jgi:aldose 1-epimerase
VTQSSITRRTFGVTPTGEPVDSFTLTSGTGIEVTLIGYGAAIQQVWVPDRVGRLANVVLGFPSLLGYTSNANHYFGAVIGRYANRIAAARFDLDGITYELPRNDGEHSLHGGPNGFDKQVWEPVAASATLDGARVVFRFTSADLEMGYPGRLQVEAAYTLDHDSLRLDLSAATDRPTIVNLTGHALWNLGGEGAGAIDDHHLTLNAKRYTPVDEALIPTGEVATVEGTPLDFLRPAPIGARIDAEFHQLLRGRGYDHNFVLEGGNGESLVHAARVEDPLSGRVLDVWTTEPGLQLYTGNLLDGSLVGSGGRPYGLRAGLALEPQHFPDSVHHENFPSTVLRPTGAFRSTTIYRFATSDR